MKKLLLIMGDLATGKTTFAHALSKRYDTPMFFKDVIKETLGDTIGFSNREENLKLSHASMELMFLIFSEFAKLDKDLILESNFHRAELEKIHEMAQDYGYEVLTLVLRGDLEIIHKRYLHRVHHENRHPVHLSTPFDLFEEFKAYIEHSRTELPLGEAVYIQADTFDYQTDEDLLKKLDVFMGISR